jgi:hypothetical protein
VLTLAGKLLERVVVLKAHIALHGRLLLRGLGRLNGLLLLALFLRHAADHHPSLWLSAIAREARV